MNSFARDAGVVAASESIDFFTDMNKAAVMELTEDLATMSFRMCSSAGHEPSSCPFNAQMARAAGKTPRHHEAWVCFRRGRETLIAANRVFTAAKATAASKKAISKCKIAAATGSG